jgi:hypothetical protein
MDWVNTGRGPQGDDFRGLEVVDSRDLVSNTSHLCLPRARKPTGMPTADVAAYQFN